MDRGEMLHSSESQSHLLVLQSTSFCNIDCSYCYLPGRHLKGVMELAGLPKILESLYTFPTFKGNITVLWHAGEPCVLPPNYYEKAISIIEESRPKWINFQYSILTNGTLLSEKWINVLNTPNFRLGLSVDGPARFHDCRRVTRARKGTHARVMESIHLLNQEDIPFYVITVLSPDALDYPEEFAEFYATNRIQDIGFNIDELEGSHLSTSFGGTQEDIRRFKNFLLRFISHSATLDYGAVNLRELHSGFRRLRAFSEHHKTGGDKPVFNEQTEPFAIISVGADGSVSTFSPELLTSNHPSYGNFKFGNLYTDTFDEIWANGTFREVWGSIARGVELCSQTCGYFGVCSGGAPSNKLFENDTFSSGETRYCQYTQKAIFDLCMDLIEGQKEGPFLEVT